MGIFVNKGRILKQILYKIYFAFRSGIQLQFGKILNQLGYRFYTHDLFLVLNVEAFRW